jgi:hypothetical protein
MQSYIWKNNNNMFHNFIIFTNKIFVNIHQRCGGINKWLSIRHDAIEWKLIKKWTYINMKPN